jgi:hypothetical protein
MSKYEKRIQSEFEDILLLKLINISTTYQDAYNSAEKYAKEFSNQRKLNKDEYKFILEYCVDMAEQWFPDTSDYNISIKF